VLRQLLNMLTIHVRSAADLPRMASQSLAWPGVA